MKEYTFNAVAIHVRENVNGSKSVIVHCHESEDSRLVINCGEQQVRLIEKTAEGIFYESDGA